MEKNKKLPGAVKIIGIVLLVLAVVWGGFTIISHAVYHRSNMASLVEIYFRVIGTKDTFSDDQECAEYIEERRNAEEYTLNVKLKSEISESSVNGCKIYSLSQTETPDYTILYLHGGAYINDASVYQWKFCDKIVQETNAEVIFPIYPLAPNHTWEETYDLLTEVYQDILNDTDTPVIIMGDSAGGGLSVSFCEYLSEINLEQPDKMILLSPWMDISMSNPEAADYEASDPMLSAYGLIEMGKCWAGDLELTDYRVSPVFGDISVLQNVYLFVGTREIFFPDVTEFYSMLQKQGVVSELYIGEGMNHVYPLYPIPEADEALEQICKIIITP
ncbi:MAG: alpha/beta hydrolase [Clostridia bacterium]|nr:alpha/beta hydrolase [Clostridia bacterium]